LTLASLIFSNKKMSKAKEDKKSQTSQEIKKEIMISNSAET